MDNSLPVKSRTSIIKSYLKKQLPSWKFSVKKSTGTASHWIHIDVSVPKDTVLQKDSDIMIEKMAMFALHENGQSFARFYADDNYNTERNCVLIQFNYF